MSGLHGTSDVSLMIRMPFGTYLRGGKSDVKLYRGGGTFFGQSIL